MASVAAGLSRRPGAALAGLTALVAAYTAAAGLLWDGGLAWDIAFLCLILFPATFLLVWLALPLAQARGLLPLGVALVVLAALLRAADLNVAFNLAKLFALVALGFWFLSYFETVAWAVLVAAIIPWVDAVSVWRGPTDYVVSEKPGIFEDVAVAFRLPGENDAAHLGPPDILFFSLFLAAAARFGLRTAWTWLGMVALLGATLLLTATTDVNGLPALPAICIGFLLPNADLIWRALRRRARARSRIFGRTDSRLWDFRADLIERSPQQIVLLTRGRPPHRVVLEPEEAGTSLDPEDLAVAGNGVVCRFVIDGEKVALARVEELPHGLLVVPHDDDPTLIFDVYPEQLAADEAKVERLKRELR
jgi:hypothetical protein